MQRIKDLLVRIRGDESHLEKRLESASRKTAAVGRRLERMGRSFTVGVTLPILAVGGAAAKMAANAEESENLFSVSMGRMEAAGRKFSERLRDELGLNDFALRGQLGTMKAMTESMGLSEGAAYQLAAGLTQLAGDLESFYNLRSGEGFEKLRAGIAGESEPLKRLGVLVTENVIKQTALRHGLIRTGESLTEGQKVLARYLAIVEQTSKAQGDQARTLDSTANLWRRLQAAVERTAIRFGRTLTPALGGVLKIGLGVVSMLERGIERWEGYSEGTRRAVLGATAFVAALGPVLMGIGTLLQILGGFKAGMTLLFLNPVALGVAAAGTFAFAAVTIARNWDAAKVRLTLIWAAIKGAVFGAVDGILGMLERLTENIPIVGTKVAELRTRFDDFATDSLGKTGDRLATLEREIVDGYVPAAGAAAVSTDDWKLSIEGLFDEFERQGAAGGPAGKVSEVMTTLADRLRRADGLARISALNYDVLGEKTTAYRTAIEGLIAAGLDPADERVQSLVERYQRLAEWQDNLADAADVMAQRWREGEETKTKATEDWRQSVAGTVASMVDVGRSGFKAWADSFLQQIGRMIGRLLVFRALAGVLSPFAGQAGFLGSLFKEFNAPFGGARAAGGPVEAGRAYRVGERGPETFVPTSRGTIVPDQAAGGHFRLTLDFSGMPPARNPMASARDGDWQRFLSESLRAFQDNGGRLTPVGA